MNHVVVIAFKELRDRFRSGWIITCMLVWLGVILLTSILGLIQIGQIGVQGYQRTTLSLLNLIQYLVPLLGLLVGHDSLVREREDRTLNLLLACGLPRAQLILGKFIGCALTLATPLLLGFAVAGSLIGLAARDAAVGPFLKLALSGVALGIVFCAVGLLLSTLARSRVQALACALLVWGVAVFAFDLAALGIIVSTRAVKASQEIDLVCDATHINSQADIHSTFDTNVSSQKKSPVPEKTFQWLWFNPVDLFRLLNLPGGLGIPFPASGAILSLAGWLGLTLGAAVFLLQTIDL